MLSKSAVSMQTKLSRRTMVMGGAAFNACMVIHRFTTMPSRDASEDYNFSLRFLAWFELILLLSNILSGIQSIAMMDAFISGTGLRPCVALANLPILVQACNANVFQLLGSVKNLPTKLLRVNVGGVDNGAGSAYIGALVGLMLTLIPMSFGAILGVWLKLSQVGFAGQVATEWTFNQWLEFMAFLNNLADLDGSNKPTTTSSALIDFLFQGRDAKTDTGTMGGGDSSLPEAGAIIGFKARVAYGLVENHGTRSSAFLQPGCPSTCWFANCRRYDEIVLDFAQPNSRFLR